jgi:hypothetical protein
MSGEPAFDRGMLVGGVVVHHQMDVELCANIGPRALEEVEIFMVTMPAFAGSDRLPGGDIQGGEQGLVP